MPNETSGSTQGQPNDERSFFPKQLKIFCEAYAYNLKEASAGVFASLINFPGDRIIFFAQTIQSSGQYGTPRDFFYSIYYRNYSLAFKNSLYLNAVNMYFKTPFNGLGINLLNSTIKNGFLFPTKAFFLWGFNSIDPQSEKRNIALSGFFAGLTIAYLMRYLSTAKFRRFNGEKLSDIVQLSSEQLGAGFGATALRDGLYYGTYFHLLNILNEKSEYAVLNGFLAGACGAFISNPPSVVAANLKIAKIPLDAFEMSKNLYKDGGVGRFYKGFGFTLFRMGVQGAAVNVVLDHFQNKNEEEDKNEEHLASRKNSALR